MYIADRLIADLEPDRQTFPHLKYPPFLKNIRDEIYKKRRDDMKIEGYVTGRKLLPKMMSGRGADRQLLIMPDHSGLVGDGIDATRVVLKVTENPVVLP